MSTAAAVPGAAILAVDPPAAPGRPRLPIPCRILDGDLRPIGSTIADGTFRSVPSGLVVLILARPDGSAWRRVVAMEPGRRYRLHYFRQPADAPAWRPESLADEETLRTISYLESGQIHEARQLVEARLKELRRGSMGDPVAAAVVGYVLLQEWEYAELWPWCLDLPHDYPWLADAFVIAAEWHAQAGKHLTALNYLRQLEQLRLPVFTLGLARALERLAVYRVSPTATRPSERILATLPSFEDSSVDPAQVLGHWDVEAASNAYDRLAARTFDVDPWTLTTEGGTRPGTRMGWSARFTRRNVQQKVLPAGRPVRRPEGALSMSTNGDETVKEKRSGISGLPLYVAIGAVLVWIAFVVVMLLSSDASETQWTRLTFVFASVEAIAFAAAGALFGVTVQRERVEKAEQRAEQNESEATAGRALATMALADEAQVIEQDRDSAFESYGPEQERETDVRRRHAEAARRLFPDL
jgi:hypothetical protein